MPEPKAKESGLGTIDQTFSLDARRNPCSLQVHPLFACRTAHPWGAFPNSISDHGDAY